MKSVWFGSDNSAPSTTVASYNFLMATIPSSWGSLEDQRTTALSESVVITGLRVYVDTAPGTTADHNYTFAIRDDVVTTAASLTISGTSTSGSWSGSVSIAALSLVCIVATPGTVAVPTASTNIYWQIDYETAGQYFLMTGGGQSVSSTAINYGSPSGNNLTTLGTTADSFEILIPSGGTITKMVTKLDGSPGTAKSYAVSARHNDSTDNFTSTISDAETVEAVTGSLAVSAGDRLAIKVAPTGTPTARRLVTCLTIAPTINGETFIGFGNQGAPSTTASNYEQPMGVGAAGWSATEGARVLKPQVATYKKLYVKLITAPGGAVTRRFTIRDNSVATTLLVSITGASTTGNNTTDSFTLGASGNTMSVLSSVLGGTAAATAGVKMGYVIDVPQPTSTTGQIKTPSTAKPTKVNISGTWVTKPIKRWDGSSWVVTNY